MRGRVSSPTHLPIWREGTGNPAPSRQENEAKYHPIRTCLAVHLAHHLREHYADGHGFVDLQVSCGVPPFPLDQKIWEPAHGDNARSPRRLLIADDVGGIGEISSFLLPDNDSLLIATTRNPLQSIGQDTYQHTMTALTHDDAMTLAARIARTTRPPDPPEQLRRLATLCTNLPLALWMAAGRAVARPLMPLAAITEDLRAESTPWLALATGTEQHDEALRAVLTCCYNALPASLARAVRLLASHPGPDFTAAAAQVVLERPAGQVTAALHALASAHWVECIRHDRYRLPTAVRSFAAGQARIEEKPDDLVQLFERVAGWYLRTAHAAAGEIHAPTFALTEDGGP